MVCSIRCWWRIHPLTRWMPLDLSVLPSNAPQLLLSAPSSAAPAFIGVALAFSLVFLITFTLISFRHKLPGKMSAGLDAPLLHQASAWIGVLGFMIGECIWLCVMEPSLIYRRFHSFPHCAHVVWQDCQGFQRLHLGPRTGRPTTNC